MRIPRTILKLWQLAAKEASRYSLNYLRFERTPEKCMASVSDGRLALIAKWNEPSGDIKPRFAVEETKVPAFAVNIAAELLRHADAAWPPAIPGGNADYCILNESSVDRVKLVMPSAFCVMRLEEEADDGTMPPISDVIPKYQQIIDRTDWGKDAPTATVIDVNARRLARLLLAITEACPDENDNTVTLTVPLCSSRPLMVTAKNDDGEALGLLMPLQRHI